MTFYRFMMRNYSNGDGAKRDLAYDMYDDKEQFPKNGVCKFNAWHKILRDYLENQGACDDCLDTFEECWKEYEQCERKRLKMRL